MTDIEFYNVGDYVMVDNQTTRKLEIGRIEEIMEQYNTFSYIVYLRPEDTHCGRLNFHGKNEIFKTPMNQEESMLHINSKVEVLKLPDYARLPREEKFTNNRFVCRQNYDPTEQKFSEIDPDCFCNRIINPDDDLVICECERVYHYQCIGPESATCSTCFSSVQTLGDAIYKKRKLEEDNSVLLKNQNEDAFYELFASALDEAATDKKENNNYNQAPSYNTNNTIPNKSLNDKRPISDLSMRKNPSNPAKIAPPGGRKPSRKELNNIDDDAFQRIKFAIENFSKTHQNRSMNDVERSRYFIKEKYYKSLLYGIEEVKERQKNAGSHLHLNEGERLIALRDERENYKKAQDAALSIEANVWHGMNKNKMRIDPNYNMKNRELLNYLMDDNNYELRLSVLTGERKPEFLIKATGKELVSKEMSEKIEKRELKTLKQSLLPDEIKIIAKSHKGETVIESQPEPEVKKMEVIPEPEPTENEADTITELVNQIERGSSDMKGTPLELPEESDSKIPGSGEDGEFSEFKLTKRHSSARKNGNDSPPERPERSLPNKLDRKMSSAKKGEDSSLQITSAGANKLIDPEVLKSTMNFFFEKTYNNITERLNAHLKPTIANNILNHINNKYKSD